MYNIIIIIVLWFIIINIVVKNFIKADKYCRTLMVHWIVMNATEDNSARMGSHIMSIIYIEYTCIQVFGSLTLSLLLLVCDVCVDARVCQNSCPRQVRLKRVDSQLADKTFTIRIIYCKLFDQFNHMHIQLHNIIWPAISN